MIFTNEQNFVDSPNMMVKCSQCDRILHKARPRNLINPRNEDLKEYLIHETKKYQINYYSNCGHKLVIPKQVIRESFNYGLGLGKTK